MWCKRLHVKNIRPFRDLDLTFKRGLVGLFGPNGSGKTTIVDLIYAVLTNDFGRFFQLRIELIHPAAGPREESSVTGWFEHEGTKFTLMRALRPAKGQPKHSLIVEGEEEITDDNKIRERLEEIIQTDRESLDRFTFKRADKIYDILVATDAERKKAFQALNQTENCEELYDLFGDFLSKDTELNAEIIDNSDELATQIATLKDEIADNKKEIKKQSKRLMTPQQVKIAARIAKKLTRLEDLQEQLATAEKRQPKAISLDKKAVKREKRTRRELETAKAEVAKLKPGIAALRTIADDWEKYEKNRKARRRAQEAIDELTKEKEGVTPVVMPTGYTKGGLRKLRDDLVTLRATLQRAKDVLAVLEKDGTVECPTCGTPVTKLEKHVGQQRVIVSTYPATIKKQEKDISAWQDYEEALDDHSKWQARFDSRWAAAVATKEALKTVEKPSGNQEESEAKVTAFDLLESSLDDLQTAWTNASTALATRKAKLESLTKRIGDIAQAIQKNHVSEQKAALYAKREERQTKAKQEIARLEGLNEGKEVQIIGKETEVLKIKTRLKRKKRLREMAIAIARAREVVQRNGLPNAVAHANLVRMEKDVNEELVGFGDPYWVDTDEKLQFIVHKPGMSPYPAGGLSTGERVVLAISFWLAWKTKISMLALDEPTANLDEENRAFLADSLSRLTSKVRGARQIIMVSHADNLRSSFDQVVVLGT